jgi:hypothetical protein
MYFEQKIIKEMFMENMRLIVKICAFSRELIRVLLNGSQTSKRLTSNFNKTKSDWYYSYYFRFLDFAYRLIFWKEHKISDNRSVSVLGRKDGEENLLSWLL